jgi:hypothetical protein
VTVQEHFIAYCRCREAVKLFWFLLSQYSLMGICKIAFFVDQRKWRGGDGCVNFAFVLFRGCTIDVGVEINLHPF